MSDSQRLLSNLRGMRYGEVLLAYLGSEARVEVYNSFPLNDCPDELWRQLDTETIAKEAEATAALLNGPRYWLMDGIGKVQNVENKQRNFGGIDMRLVATLELDGDIGRVFYRERHVNRGAMWYFDPGTTVHELHAPNARTYVMQAYCVGVDDSLTQDNLHELGGRLDLPDGWRFSSRVLDEPLLIDTTERVATVLQDELENTYTLVGS
jgi:hypothetical protein